MALTAMLASTAAAMTTQRALLDPTVHYVNIHKQQARTLQQLPLSYCERWPVWVCSPDAASVTQIPSEGDGQSWVNPLTFEQLWLPEDLPPPRCAPAVGLVLSNGEPRYVFPCVESVLSTGAQLWHNRGLNSVPLAKTWLVWGDIPLDRLRLSAYACELPPQPAEGEAEAEAEAGDGAASAPSEPTAAPEWAPLLQLEETADAFEVLFKVMADAPAEMETGFHFLIVRLPGADLLPSSAAAPGQRLRLFLSDVDREPTLLSADEDEWAWSRGEADLSAFAVAGGGGSEFLPAEYEPLFAYAHERPTVATLAAGA